MCVYCVCMVCVVFACVSVCLCVYMCLPVMHVIFVSRRIVFKKYQTQGSIFPFTICAYVNAYKVKSNPFPLNAAALALEAAAAAAAAGKNRAYPYFRVVVFPRPSHSPYPSTK